MPWRAGVGGRGWRETKGKRRAGGGENRAEEGGAGQRSSECGARSTTQLTTTGDVHCAVCAMQGRRWGVWELPREPHANKRLLYRNGEGLVSERERFEY